VLYVVAKSGRSEDVVRFYKRERVLEKALEQSGCLSAEIQVSMERDAPILVTALWESADAYRGWLDNPVRESFASRLDELLDDSVERGVLYEVSHAVTAQPAAPAGEADNRSDTSETAEAIES
jgi:heme-degrading monooxygenase HmoA